MTTPAVASLRTSLLAATLLATFGLGAQAAEPKSEPLSRAQVRAEYLRARDAGELASAADLYRPVREAMMDSQRTIRAQALAADVQHAAALPVQRQASAAR